MSAALCGASDVCLEKKDESTELETSLQTVDAMGSESSVDQNTDDTNPDETTIEEKTDDKPDNDTTIQQSLHQLQA